LIPWRVIIIAQVFCDDETLTLCLGAYYSLKQCDANAAHSTPLGYKSQLTNHVIGSLLTEAHFGNGLSRIKHFI